MSCFIKKCLMQNLAKELCFLFSFSSNFQHSFISLYWNLVWFFCNIQPVNFVGVFCWIFLLFDFFCSNCYYHFKCVWSGMPKLSKLQIDSVILMGMIKHSRSSQNSKFAMLFKYLKKTLKMKLIFCLEINLKVS